ncbi:MAG: hypothetical protein M1837_001042 [Sclerophora amabilis]|nr:MAG: hypothetical protein M1837_001042 [Sclerophora amabilis]
MLKAVSLRLSRPSRHQASSPSSPLPSVTAFQFQADALPTEVTEALQYISRKLQSRSVHLTFILTGGSQSSIRCNQEINAVPVVPIDGRARRALESILLKANSKFPDLDKSWLQPVLNPKQAASHTDYLIRRSILQNQVLFSSESLTLLDVDYIYAFKAQLQDYTRLHRPSASNACVEMLRRVMMIYDDRPLTISYIMRAYDHLAITEQDLRQINDAYVSKYKGAAITFTAAEESARPRPVRTKAASLHVLSRSSTLRLGPKTPLTATDITPVTRCEWVMYMTGNT